MSDAYLSHFLKVYAFTDMTASNAPIRKAFDWSRSFQSVPVRNPKSQSLTMEPGDTVQLYDSTRSTGIDNTTQFAVTQSVLDTNTYRFTWTAVGTNPAFRTARSLAGLNAQDVVVTKNANSTVTIAAGTGLFASIQNGDVVFIPGVTTGDSPGPFSPLNEGFWSVLSAAANSLVLQRLPGTVFEGASETVELGATSIQAFSAQGVQIGDQVRISAGFAVAYFQTFTVLAVTPTWFEVAWASPLPLMTAIPTALDMPFYTSAKRYLRIEADQQLVVRINGVSTDELVVTPLVAGDSDQVGWCELMSTIFSLVLVNKTTVPANIDIFSAE